MEMRRKTILALVFLSLVSLQAITTFAASNQKAENARLAKGNSQPSTTTQQCNLVNGKLECR